MANFKPVRAKSHAVVPVQDDHLSKTTTTNLLPSEEMRNRAYEINVSLIILFFYYYIRLQTLLKEPQDQKRDYNRGEQKKCFSGRFRHIQGYSDIFRYNQADSGIIQPHCRSCVNFTYSETWHIENESRIENKR